MKIKYLKTPLLACLLFLPVSAQAAPSSVYLEDLTWPEVKERIQSGTNTVIVPTGGTEQNGPQLVIGKHNIIVHYTAGEIARKLGNALVAPVIAYVPEGRIAPAEGHMLFPGTISVSYQTFASVLEDTARSLKQHGFRLICFIGDHGGSQAVQKQVAENLSQEWQNQGVRVLQVSAYYDPAPQQRWLDGMGVRVPNPSAHAGLMDTSEVMAIDTQGVREPLRGNHSERDYATSGAMGDSTQATSAYGQRFLLLKIDAAVNQIQHDTAPAS